MRPEQSPYRAGLYVVERLPIERRRHRQSADTDRGRTRPGQWKIAIAAAAVIGDSERLLAGGTAWPLAAPGPVHWQAGQCRDNLHDFVDAQHHGQLLRLAGGDNTRQCLDPPFQRDSVDQRRRCNQFLD